MSASVYLTSALSPCKERALPEGRRVVTFEQLLDPSNLVYAQQPLANSTPYAANFSFNVDENSGGIRLSNLQSLLISLWTLSPANVGIQSFQSMMFIDTGNGLPIWIGQNFGFGTRGNVTHACVPYASNSRVVRGTVYIPLGYNPPDPAAIGILRLGVSNYPIKPFWITTSESGVIG